MAGKGQMGNVGDMALIQPISGRVAILATLQLPITQPSITQPMYLFCQIRYLFRYFSWPVAGVNPWLR